MEKKKRATHQSRSYKDFTGLVIKKRSRIVSPGVGERIGKIAEGKKIMMGRKGGTREGRTAIIMSVLNKTRLKLIGLGEIFVRI